MLWSYYITVTMAMYGAILETDGVRGWNTKENKTEDAETIFLTVCNQKMYTLLRNPVAPQFLDFPLIQFAVCTEKFQFVGVGGCYLSLL